MSKTKTVKGVPFIGKYAYDTACETCGEHGILIVPHETLPGRQRVYCAGCKANTWQRVRSE